MNEPMMKKPMMDQQDGHPGYGGTLQPNLSGQQLQALAKNHADHLAHIKRDVELRKWAVDQACGLIGAYNEYDDTVMGLARDIHHFLVEGAVEKAE
jgi:hypothetical protein